jgi:hypothetical protein
MASRAGIARKVYFARLEAHCFTPKRSGASMLTFQDLTPSKFENYGAWCFHLRHLRDPKHSDFEYWEIR